LRGDTEIEEEEEVKEAIFFFFDEQLVDVAPRHIIGEEEGGRG